MQRAVLPLNSYSVRRGFTIVELLIVIVVISILAAITIVAYNGVQARAQDSAMLSEASQAGEKVLAYQVTNSNALPADTTVAGIAAGAGRDIYYRVTPDGKNFCVAVNITGSLERAYSFTSTNPVAKRGTCQGYVLVPGNAALGTSDFWVMKYEAKNVNGTAYSQAASTPWVNISQTDAISKSTAACDGCHLISEAEWMTLAGDVLGVSSNWSGGSVGNGFIFSGHNDNASNVALAASSLDSDGYFGTGNSGSSGANQRRTLTLSNGEILWDLAGNVNEWTSGQYSGAQPGVSGDTAYTFREQTDAGFSWSSVPAVSRPSAALAQAGSWSGQTKGIGAVFSNPTVTSTRGMFRSGNAGNGWFAGVLAVGLSLAPTDTNSSVGLRVAR